LTLEDEADRLLEPSVRNYHCPLHNVSEERSYKYGQKLKNIYTPKPVKIYEDILNTNSYPSAVRPLPT